MSQSSVAEQVEEMKAAGIPVRQGTRMKPPETRNPKDIPQFGSDLWFSRWCSNAFRNYPTVSKARGIRFLAESAKGLPAFVLGVGPSLDDSIKILKGLRCRAIIISTDAAFRACLANGVTPDIVVSYDCKAEQKLLWDDVPPHKVPALLNSCTHPNTIASWGGPVLFFNQYHEQDDLCKRILPGVFPEIGQIPSAGTVGNMAVLAAHALGCSPICVVGMDFCYQPVAGDVVAYRYRAQDWKYVTNVGEGIPDGWQKTEIKELYDNDDRLARSFSVKGTNGKEFISDRELVFYHQSFVDLMKHFSVSVTNCTPAGRLVEFPTMTVEDAVTKYCPTEWQEGRTVLHHLARIIPDPRVKS